MERNLNDLAREKFAYIQSDGSGFRRAARILQSLWRERSGLPMGEHNGFPLGSRLPLDYARREMSNFLTEGIQGVVNRELADADEEPFYSVPRIYNDLLSSQPLCFNLFGELKLDLDFATSILKMFHPGIQHVTDIRFEYSPGRSDQRFTGDKSAFDVFIEYVLTRGRCGFFGIEVKYHENLKDKAASHRPRYDEVAQQMNCFKEEKLSALRQAPLQQFWRDHLLAGSMLLVDSLGYTEGSFIVLYPAANAECRLALKEYKKCLCDSTTFDSWTLEEFVAVLGLKSSKPWIEVFRQRYLDFSQLDDGVAME